MINSNIIAIMTWDQFIAKIPEGLKKTAWHRADGPDGKLIYTEQNWKQMSEDPMFKIWYGETIVIENSKWLGKSIGTRYIVKGRMKLHTDNVRSLTESKLDLVMTPKQLTLYLQENNIT